MKANPVTPEKIDLGKALFFDPRMSASGVFSCNSCHSGVNPGGNGHYPFGLIEKPVSDILPEKDKGRCALTETADDEYVFRASPQRNIELTASCFHSGLVWDLKVAFQIMGESQLGEDLGS